MNTYIMNELKRIKMILLSNEQPSLPSDIASQLYSAIAE